MDQTAWLGLLAERIRGLEHPEYAWAIPAPPRC